MLNVFQVNLGVHLLFLHNEMYTKDFFQSLQLDYSLYYTIVSYLS